MENATSTEKTYIIKRIITDYSVSTFLGLSIGVVTSLFAITLWAIQLAKIKIGIFTGEFSIGGDPTVLYLAIFLISATMLLVVQFHFQQKYLEQQEEREN